MRRHFLIAGLLVVGLLAGVTALAAAKEDVSLQYSGDSVSVRNDGDSSVSVVVQRTCTAPAGLPGLNVPMVRDLKAVAHPDAVVRIDRNRNGACTYVITGARYVRKFGSGR